MLTVILETAVLVQMRKKKKYRVRCKISYDLLLTTLGGFPALAL
jgi:hypothetical protein